MLQIPVFYEDAVPTVTMLFKHGDVIGDVPCRNGDDPWIL